MQAHCMIKNSHCETRGKNKTNNSSTSLWSQAPNKKAVNADAFQVLVLSWIGVKLKVKWLQNRHINLYTINTK